MRTFSISTPARADIDEALAYLDERSPPAAEALAVDIDARISLLTAQPGIGRRRDDLLPGLRSSVVGKYVLLYRYSDTLLEVVRVLHGSRDIPRIMRDADDE